MNLPHVEFNHEHSPVVDAKNVANGGIPGAGRTCNKPTDRALPVILQVDSIT